MAHENRTHGIPLLSAHHERARLKSMRGLPRRLGVRRSFEVRLPQSADRDLLFRLNAVHESARGRDESDNLHCGGGELPAWLTWKCKGGFRGVDFGREASYVRSHASL
jgi:hypothetical protein